jgi:hypothetical protein
VDGEAVTPPQAADSPRRAVRACAGGGSGVDAVSRPVPLHARAVVAPLPESAAQPVIGQEPVNASSPVAGQAPPSTDSPAADWHGCEGVPARAPGHGTPRLQRRTPLIDSVLLTGTDTAVHLPQWTMPAAARSFAIDFSIVSQIDGLSAKCLGQGARIERDVMATSAETAVCHVYGHAQWMSSSSFCGFYFCDFDRMPHVIATVASHRGYGVFIVPRFPRRYPAIAVLRKNQDGTGVVRRYGWYDYLVSHALLTFDLPVGTFTTPAGAPVRHPYGVQAVVAQFGQNGRFKAVPRPEHHFRLQLVPALLADGPKLGVRPVLLHRVSHLATDGTRVITPANDCAPPSPAFVVPPGASAPTPLQSRWASVMHELRRLADSYPCQQVADLALQVATTGVNPYRGTFGKPVMHREPRVRDNVSELAMRRALMKEIVPDPPDASFVPRIAGPLEACPYENARVCPGSTREKDPYDPESDRLRFISDFSRRSTGQEDGSTNDLCWSPSLLSYHATAGHIRDTLAWMFLCFGPGIQAWTADIPSCFRLNHLHAALLSLFVYKIVTLEHGTEWFVDLATPFGWTPAEWGWQCMLALILWAFRTEGLPEMFAYVDNFFYLSHPAAGGRRTKAIFDQIASIFTRLGIPLHELMIGTRFKGLGWMWDTSPTDGPPCMVCADDKYEHLQRMLPEWAAAVSLPYREVESIVGFLAWMSAGFPAGIPHLAYLRACLSQHKGGARSVHPVMLSKQAREALAFWCRFIPHWDMRCPVFLDFGPMVGPEVLWRFDASTDWGMGAFMWVVGSPIASYIKHEWTDAERKHAFVVDRVSTGVMEGMAAVRCAAAFSVLCQGKRVLMEGDNEALTRGLRKCYSRTPAMLGHIHTVWSHTSRARICLRHAHVKGVALHARLVARARSPSPEITGYSRLILCVQVPTSTQLLITCRTTAPWPPCNARKESSEPSFNACRRTQRAHARRPRPGADRRPRAPPSLHGWHGKLVRHGGARLCEILHRTRPLAVACGRDRLLWLAARHGRPNQARIHGHVHGGRTRHLHSRWARVAHDRERDGASNNAVPETEAPRQGQRQQGARHGGRAGPDPSPPATLA